MRDKPQINHTGDANELFVQSRNNFPEGSFGREVFPEQLEGRLRPNIFSIFPIRFGRETDGMLREIGVVNLEDIMNHTSDTDESSFSNRKNNHLRRSLENTIRKKVVPKYERTRHGMLLELITNEDQGAVPPNDELGISHAVGNYLSHICLQSEVRPASIIAYQQKISKHTNSNIISLNPDEFMGLIKYKFGLNDFDKIPSYKDVQQEYGFTNQDAARTFIAKKIFELVELDKKEDSGLYDTVQKLSTYPSDTIGRLVGLIYRSEAPEEEISIDEIEITRVQYWAIKNLLNHKHNLSGDMPQSAHQDITLKNILELHIDCLQIPEKDSVSLLESIAKITTA